MSGLNQADLANLVGVSRPNISFWENAKYPPLEAIDKICRALGMKLWEFFADDSVNERHYSVPERYVTLINELSQLDKEDSDNLLDIIGILIRKYGKATASHEDQNRHDPGSLHYNKSEGTQSHASDHQAATVTFEDYKFPYTGQNTWHIAITNYLDRFSWV